eukprot:TRINITY_DN2489_c0_g1_i3.p1 TRINITY_DN2489_c0_g1~~TRINITY_DN2489_c0_g1_i3.p1  ORF type:complete len:183 (+),score=16.13 TRINITY_DN2489_c0_g1_i3:332-880(+)
MLASPGSPQMAHRARAPAAAARASAGAVRKHVPTCTNFKPSIQPPHHWCSRQLLDTHRSISPLRSTHTEAPPRQRGALINFKLKLKFEITLVPPISAAAARSRSARRSSSAQQLLEGEDHARALEVEVLAVPVRAPRGAADVAATRGLARAVTRHHPPEHHPEAHLALSLSLCVCVCVCVCV